MNTLIKRLSFVIGLTLPYAYAQNIPNIGRASDVLWSKSSELNIGKATYDRLYQQGNIHENQADSDYLNYLGHKIDVFADTRLGLNFYITNSNSINAFATPGGYVAINAGLVLASENEHELAGVLAHEIAHISQDHIARSILAAKDRQIANTAAMIAGILLSSAGDSSNAGPGLITAVVAGETQSQINDIRRHEVEADQTGREYMTKAGFDEQGMISFFGKLQSPAHAELIPAYLLTHPLPQERQSALDNPHKRGGSKYLRSSDEYFLFRARLRAQNLNTERLKHIAEKERNNSRGQIRDAGLFLTALVNMKQAKFSDALANLAHMKTSMQNKRDVLLLKAKINILNGKSNIAAQGYQSLWRKYAGDSVVAYDYAGFLMRNGQVSKAEKILKPFLNSEELNPGLCFLHGQILGKLGKRNQQNRLLIRYYQQTGDYEQALSQAKIAASLSSDDWEMQSAFEAKQKELQKIIDNLENN
ncbi:MAG: M48 family metalloprotease [Gammaproteobacteria bacterium]|nr:M48 family metalloprotease [Gammaproteobacteria bacterium]